MHNYDLGNRIYELRKSKGLSQKELGEMLGVTNKAVSKWENATAIPKTDTLVKLSEIFGVSPQELLQGKTNDKITLSQLSSKTNEMFLKEELEKRDKEIMIKKRMNSKKYFTIIISLIASSIVIQLLLFIDADNTLKWYEVVFDCLMGSYLLCGLFNGAVFTVRLVKKSPAWILVVMFLLFPVTLLVIEFVGVVITPSYLINSIKNMRGGKTNE